MNSKQSPFEKGNLILPCPTLSVNRLDYKTILAIKIKLCYIIPMSKKTALFLSLILIFVVASVPVSAKVATPSGQGQQIREEVKGKIQNLKDKIQNFKNTRAGLKQAKLTSKSDTALTVEKEGKIYTVNISDKTHFRRRFWGKATLSEMSVGDLLDIQGKWADDQKTIINATLIRDTSIQMRFGTFFGTVTSISGSTITMQTKKRDFQTVTASSSAKIINRKQQTMSLSDILVGHKIRVKGLWNNLAKTITQVKEIKDFTLPIVNTTTTPAPSVAPSSTPIPSATPSPTPTLAP